MATISKVDHYKVSSADVYFFDTNIWILLFAPIANTNLHKQEVYGNLLREIQQAKAKIKISSLVISEFMNACLKLRFNQWKDFCDKEAANYKRDFKGTSDYLSALEEVKGNTSIILRMVNRMPDGFISVDMDKILAEIEDKDFNDAYYIEICRMNKIKIVTDDADLLSAKGDVEIITDRI